MATCPQCRTEQPDGYVVCGRCGIPAPRGMPSTPSIRVGTPGGASTAPAGAKPHIAPTVVQKGISLPTQPAGGPPLAQRPHIAPTVVQKGITLPTPPAANPPKAARPHIAPTVVQKGITLPTRPAANTPMAVKPHIAPTVVQKGITLPTQPAANPPMAAKPHIAPTVVQKGITLPSQPSPPATGAPTQAPPPPGPTVAVRGISIPTHAVNPPRGVPAPQTPQGPTVATPSVQMPQGNPDRHARPARATGRVADPPAVAHGTGWDAWSTAGLMPPRVRVGGEVWDLVTDITLRDPDSEEAHSFAFRDGARLGREQGTYRYPNGGGLEARGYRQMDGEATFRVRNVTPYAPLAIVRQVLASSEERVTVRVGGRVVAEIAGTEVDDRAPWRNRTVVVPGNRVTWDEVTVDFADDGSPDGVTWFHVWCYQPFTG